MPTTKAAKKALKRSLFLRARNLQFKIPMKKAIKAVRKGVKEGLSADKIKELLVDAYSKIDRAAKRNIVHHKAAARLKSRLTELVQKKLGVKPFEEQKKTSKKASSSASEAKQKKASDKTETKKSSSKTAKKATAKKTTKSTKSTKSKSTSEDKE